MVVTNYLDDFARCIPNGVLGGTFALLCCFIIIVFASTRNWETAKKWVISGLLIEYLILILCTTVICRTTHPEYDFELIPFWSYKAGLEGRIELFYQILLNILLFIPIGLLVGFISKPKFWWKAFIFGICFSTCIELFQLAFKKGLFEFDDIIHNTLGCMIGYWSTLLISNVLNNIRIIN